MAWPRLTQPALRRLARSYLPSSSTYDRLMFAIQAFVAQGIYVVLDYQVRARCVHAR